MDMATISNNLATAYDKSQLNLHNKIMDTAITSKILGWKEWLALPELGIPAVKVKVDTGAKTSALHAFKLEPFTKSGEDHIRFWFHPAQNRTDIELVCEAPIYDQRVVTDSGGHKENRYVIKTNASIAEKEWPIEITLTSREDMQFRMLLGRKAVVSGKFLVDASADYVTGKELGRVYNKYIKELS